MRDVPAKVGTIPMTVDLRRKRRVKVDEVVYWRRSNVHGAKWERGYVDKVNGDAKNPTTVFICR